MQKLFLKISQYLRKKICVGVSFDEVAGFQVLRTPILKKSANGCLVHNISLKTLKLDQGATEIFISEFEIKESLCNVMSEIYKKREVSKDCLNYQR